MERLAVSFTMDYLAWNWLGHNAQDPDSKTTIDLFASSDSFPTEFANPNHVYGQEDERGAESIEAIRCLRIYCCGDRRRDWYRSQ